MSRLAARASMNKKAKKRNAPPNSYATMPYYFPTEQVDKRALERIRVILEWHFIGA